MRRIPFALIATATFATAALGAHAAGRSGSPTRIVDVRHAQDDAADPTETPSAAATATPDAPDDSDGRVSNGVKTSGAVETPSADDARTVSGTPDAPDDSDGRVGGGHGIDDGPGDDHGDDEDDDRGDDHGGDDHGSDDSGSGGGDHGGSNSGRG